MSDTDILDALRTKLRELELDHVQLAGRILEVNECIALVEHGPRRKPGRPRKPTAGLTVINEPECDEQGRGILKTEDSAA